MNDRSDQRATSWRTALQRPFAWLDTGLAWFERTALVAGIAAMATVSVANVISRNTLGASLQYANDVTQILLVLVTFMGIGIGAREARHIRVSAIHDLLPKGARKVLLVWVSLTTSALLLLLASYAWDYARSTQRSCRVLPESIDLPLAVGVMLTLVALILAGHGIRLIHERVGALLQRFGPVMQKVFLSVAAIATLLIAAWLFSLFLELVDNRTGRCRVTSSTGFPVYLVHMVVPLGFLLGAIQFLLAGIRNLTSRDNYLSWYRRDEYLSASEASTQTDLGDSKNSSDSGSSRQEGKANG